MPTYDAGDARLRIVPDARGFLEKLEADLKRINADFKVNVGAETAQAAADIRRFKDIESRNNLGIGVDVGLAQAQADLARFRAAQAADGIAIRVDADTGEASAKIAKLRAEAADWMGPVKWSAGAGVIGLLPTMATGLAGITSAIQELSQAGLAMPGIMAAAGASLGTILLGTAGLKDAFKELGKQDGSQKELDKLNDQLAKLSPNAREFVTSIAGLKPQFDDLKNTVQDNLFAGIGAQIKTLTDADLPMLKAGLGGIATALNHDMTEVLRVAGTDQTKGLLDRIIGNTGGAQERFKTAIEPILNGMLTLSAASTDILPRLADGFGKAATRFDTFIKAADENGNLDKWTNEGIDGLDHLGNTLVNVGKSLNAVTTAFGGGDGLLSMLQRGSDELQVFLNSTQGQDMLKKVFADGRAELDKWMPILEQLPGLFQGVLAASQAWTSVILPPLAQIASVLGQHPALVQAVATAFLAWKTVSFAGGILGQLGSISSALGVVGGGGLIGKLGVALSMMGAMGSFDAGRAGGFSWAALGESAAGGAAIGGSIAGLPGAAIGGVLGAGASAITQGATPVKVPDANAPKPVPQSGGGGWAFGEDSGPSLPSTAPAGGDGSFLYGGSHAKGGPTRNGRGNGPTGGWISELHADEWVVNARGRATLGDDFLAGVNAGKIPGFIEGGDIDEWGNPRHPGARPGPIAPNPTGGSGGFGAALGGALSGLGNVAGMFGPGKTAGAGAGAPQDFAHQWFPWLGPLEKDGPLGVLKAMPDKIQPQNLLKNFGSALLGTDGKGGGLLGAFGLSNSIASPSNPWNKAAQSVSGFYTGKFGGGDSTDSGGSGGGLDDNAVASKLAGMGFTPDQISSVITKRDATAQRDAMMQQLTAAGLSPSDVQAAMAALGGGGKAPAAGYSGGSDAIHNTVYKAFKAAGFPDDQWPDMVKLVNGESGWNPKAKNPSSSAYGLGQFLDGTWATVGGKKTSNAADQAQMMMAYIAGRYGDPKKAYGFWESHSPHWYDVGGGLKPGLTLAMNETGQDERVLTPAQNKAFESMVDVATKNGGQPGQTPPNQLEAMRPPRSDVPAPQQPTGSAPKPVTPAPASSPDQQPTQSKPKQPTLSAPQVSAAPSSYDHELPAIKQGVNSTASTIASIASMAINAAASAGSFGVNAAAGAAGKDAGSLVAGLIKEGGKVVNDVVNVPSSLLVGTITGGTQDSAYGTTLASQPHPAAGGANSMPGRVQNNQFYGMDVNKVFQQLDLRDAQAHQAALAARPR